MGLTNSAVNVGNTIEYVSYKTMQKCCTRDACRLLKAYQQCCLERSFELAAKRCNVAILKIFPKPQTGTPKQQPKGFGQNIFTEVIARELV